MGQEEESAEWAAYIAAKNAIEIAKAKARAAVGQAGQGDESSPSDGDSFLPREGGRTSRENQ